MKFSFYAVIAALLICSIFASCSEDQYEQRDVKVSDHSPILSLKTDTDGRLIVSSLAELENLESHLIDLSSSGVVARLEIPNFESSIDLHEDHLYQKSRYLEADEYGDLPFLYDSYLMSFLNKNGELNINDELIARVKDEYTYLFPKENRKLIKSFKKRALSGKLSLKSGEWTTFESKEGGTLYVFKNVVEGVERDDLKARINRFFDYNNRRKLFCGAYSVNSGLLAKLVAITYAKKKRWGWYGLIIDSISVEGWVDVLENGIPRRVNFNVNDTHQKKVEVVIARGTASFGNLNCTAQPVSPYLTCTLSINSATIPTVLNSDVLHKGVWNHNDADMTTSIMQTNQF